MSEASSREVVDHKEAAVPDTEKADALDNGASAKRSITGAKVDPPRLRQVKALLIIFSGFS